jgi:hypothetical protein
MRADAHAVAGAASFQLRDVDRALLHLDSALTGPSAEMRGRAHLWRARVHRQLGDVARAWADLDEVKEGDPSFAAVQLERINFGIEQRDSARTAAAFAQALAHSDARRTVDTVADLAVHAVSGFGAAVAREMLSAPLPDWLLSARDSIALVRADLALRGGDTANATRELSQIAARSAMMIATAARIRLARVQLAQANGLEQLREARTTLVAAITDPAVPPLLRNMRIVEVLVSKAQTTGQAVALYAAAEVARDELGAHQLARRLFIAFVDMAPQTPWAAKGLLAALALDPVAPEAQALRARLVNYQLSPYMQVASDADADAAAFEQAEERLQRALRAMRAEGAQLAEREDLAVNRAVATLDSLRIVALNDSARLSCGLMIDTLALGGLRADSVRVACMRADTIKVAQYLVFDTMVWRAALSGGDTAAARRRVNPRGNVRRDTIR